MVFHWRLSDSKSPQVPGTLLSILAVFNNAVVWTVSTRSPTSKFSRPFNNLLVTVPKAPITIGIIVTFMFHSFFNSLARSKYLSLFSHSFSFILWSAGTAKSTTLQIFFFFVDYYKIWSLGWDYYYYNYYCFTLLRFFHTSVSSWFFSGIWVTACLLKSPGLFSVFWQILIMLLSGWFPLVLLFTSLPVPLPIF